MYMQELGSISRDQKADQDTLDNISRLRREGENKHSQKTHEKEEMVKRMNKLAEHIHTSEQALHDQNKLLRDLQQDVGSSKNKVDEVQKQLDEVLEQLGNAKTDEHDDRRKKKKQEIVNHFKAYYPGVYGRMIDMCQPTYSHYNMAITKVLGKHMEAIVVDTERTARRCIQYLKDQMLDPETFLPLDYLLIKPSIRDHVRNITEPKGVKLLYDVLQYEPHDIKNAVLFATNNVVVCESPEDANKVAYELGSRFNAVALDGTFYQKSGIISGGTVDLARKAKRWDEKHFASLQEQKEKLANELRDAMRKTRKESEIITVQSHVNGLERRLSYAKGDMNTTQTQIEKLENEIENLAREIRKYDLKIEATEQDMQKREMHIENIETKMKKVEDQVFSDFCKEIAVENIRQYEGRELRHHQARKQKCIECQMQIDRIRSNIEFETDRDTHTNVSRWERIVAEQESNLKTAKVKEARQREEIDKAMKILEEHESLKTLKKKEVEKMEKELDQARRDAKATNKDMQSLQKNVMSIESTIDKLKSAVLLHCKIEDIAIALSAGNMDDIAATDTQTSSGASSTLEQYERDATIQINFSQLSDELLHLEDDNEYKECEKKLLKAISSLQEILRVIQAPNMKAMEKLKQARGKLRSTNEEFNELKRRNNEARAAFDTIKNLGTAKFNECLDHVAREIDDIYKALSQNQAAQAHLRVKNIEEPYLDGIDYDCVAPGKRYQRMSDLSGGEKTVEALALVFAIHSFQPAPFFVLDEVDAAMDNTNIGKVAKFISEKTESLQIIVISLKEEFFSHANGLIGIYPKPGHCLISQVVTMDLTAFEV
ncbi:unnamed protein product [Ceutorhynchus assimilis]|uniref:SMC hinge domain-containing protein n=1 Tax=Ceutorhynchus assimilis TaxID=467358 RepID=A0A9N9MGG5_9CUCU|nr:unnamed protein product [Ceutorhynchus assimilis]